MNIVIVGTPLSSRALQPNPSGCFHWPQHLHHSQPAHMPASAGLQAGQRARLAPQESSVQHRPTRRGTDKSPPTRVCSSLPHWIASQAGTLVRRPPHTSDASSTLTRPAVCPAVTVFDAGTVPPAGSRKVPVSPHHLGARDGKSLILNQPLRQPQCTSGGTVWSHVLPAEPVWGPT